MLKYKYKWTRIKQNVWSQRPQVKYRAKREKIIHFGMTKAKYLRSTLILTQKQMGVAWANELKLNAIK